MSTTVRMRAADKERLRRLQRAWVGDSPPSHTDLLSMTLQFALRRRDEFLAEAAWRPLSKAEIQRLDALATDLGGWDAMDVDAVVYD